MAAESYDRFMGRYSVQLSPQLADLAGVDTAQTVLDVGCGPGALTSELVKRVGAEAVSAVDPSESFVAAVRERCPGVDVRRAAAEQLPFPDRLFDAALAQLVVHFMADPAGGLCEMARVTRPGGVLAACVWDHGGGRGPLSGNEPVNAFAPDPSDLPGVRQGDLGALLAGTGAREVEETSFEAGVDYAAFDDWWEPFTLGVGRAGAYVQRLDSEKRGELRESCRARLSKAPFSLTARAWAARGVVPGR